MGLMGNHLGHILPLFLERNDTVRNCHRKSKSWWEVRFDYTSKRYIWPPCNQNCYCYSKDGQKHGSISDMGELEFYKREAAIQSDNVARLVEALDQRVKDEKKQKVNEPSPSFLRQQAVLTKELNELREGIEYIRSQAIDK